MKDLSFQDCVEFQDCFLFEGKFSPFENVEDFWEYYPRVLIGEIGGLFNLSCKLVRSPNIYEHEIEDECADIFIYLLLFGRMLEIHDQKRVLCSVSESWHKPVRQLSSEKAFFDCCMTMMEKSLCFLKPEREHCYNNQHFLEIFLLLLQASQYITQKDWQHTVNIFHRQVILKYTDPARFTFDGLYKGSFRINIDRLLTFIDRMNLQLPDKRVNFLKRVAIAQPKYFD